MAAKKPINKVASYQRLVEDIDARLNDAARVNLEAERKMNETLKRLDNEAQTQRRQIVLQREQAQEEYRKVSTTLASGSYATINVRIPAAVRSVPSNADPQAMAVRQHNLVNQITATLAAYVRQKQAEDEAAARARAAAAALARRRALLNRPKPKPSKKLNIPLIVGIVVGVLVVVGAAVAVAMTMM